MSHPIEQVVKIAMRHWYLPPLIFDWIQYKPNEWDYEKIKYIEDHQEFKMWDFNLRLCDVITSPEFIDAFCRYYIVNNAFYESWDDYSYGRYITFENGSTFNDLCDIALPEIDEVEDLDWQDILLPKKIEYIDEDWKTQIGESEIWINEKWFEEVKQIFAAAQWIALYKWRIEEFYLPLIK